MSIDVYLTEGLPADPGHTAWILDLQGWMTYKIKEGRLATARPPGCRKHLIPSSAIQDFIETYTDRCDPEREHLRLLTDFKRRIISR